MENIIKKNGLSLGVVLGIVLILIVATMYAIDLSLLINTWVGVFNFVLIVTFGVVCSIKNKKALKGIMSFKEAFSSFILPVIVGVGMYVLFSVLLFNVIDTGAKEVVTEQVIEMTKNMMSKFNVPASDINKAIEKIENEDGFGPFAQLQSYLFQIAFYSLLGLLVSLIFKTPSNKN